MPIRWPRHRWLRITGVSLPIFLAALGLLLLGAALWLKFRRTRNWKQLFLGAGMIAVTLFFTIFTKTMLVYKPLMVVHLALSLLAWWGVMLYLWRERLVLWALLSPLVTLLLFFATAYLFNEAKL